MYVARLSGLEHCERPVDKLVVRSTLSRRRKCGPGQKSEKMVVAWRDVEDFISKLAKRGGQARVRGEWRHRGAICNDQLPRSDRAHVFLAD